MEKNSGSLERCHVVAAAILVAGLGSAVAIYLTSAEAPVDPFSEFENSKKYAHEIERMGGKAALAANAINKWFSGLWHGETLAYTVAVITLIIAAVYYYVATSLEEERRIKSEESHSAPSSGE